MALALPLHDVLPVIQVAEFTGVAGLSFVVAFTNVIAVTTVRRLIFESRIRDATAALRFHPDDGGHCRPLRLGIRQLQMPAEHPADRGDPGQHPA